MFSLFLVKINGERTFRAIIVDEALKLKVVAMGVSNSSQRYRALGTDLSNTIGLTNDGPSVYEVSITAQTNDFECYSVSGIIKHPISANNASSSYNTVIVKTMNDVSFLANVI
jgi:hypothetical protein